MNRFVLFTSWFRIFLLFICAILFKELHSNILTQKYSNSIPYICSKCGAEIGKPTPTILQMMGCGEVTLTEKSEKVVAKKGLFGWKVREPQDPEAIQE